MKKKIILWTLFILLIGIGVIYITFFMPEKTILKISNNEEVNEEFPFLQYTTMKENLINKNYTFNYEINNNGELYNYTGTKENNNYSGTLTTRILKDKTNYIYDTTKEEFTSLDNNNLKEELLYPKNILELIKDIEPTNTTYNKQRMYKYDLLIDKVETTITINTDLLNITKITIANEYYQYVLTYTDIN